MTGAGEPGVDTHWFPCEGNSPQDEESPDKEIETDGLPSIGAFATLLGILAASAFVRREREC